MSSQSDRPAALTLASALIAIHVFRATGLVVFITAPTGVLPSIFAVPALWDFFMGATALPVAWLLRRGGLLSWSAAIAWNALGLADLVVGAGIAALTPGFFDQVSRVLPPLAFAVAPIVVPTTHVLSLGALLTKGTRDHVVRREIGVTLEPPDRSTSPDAGPRPVL